MYVKGKDWIIALGLAAGAWILTVHAGAGLFAGLFTIFQIELFRRTQESHEELIRAQNQTYRQIESLMNLQQELGLRHPLPPMRGWAVSPDFANLIVSVIRDLKPARVLDVGSGVSTIVAAYALKVYGDGRIVALEHQPAYAALVREELSRHGLTDRARVMDAPLKEIRLGDDAWRWYASEAADQEGEWDLVIVDGPPANTQTMARYPALPVLFKRLSRKAVILLDDASRAEERKIVERWAREFPDVQVEWKETERGAVILRRTEA